MKKFKLGIVVLLMAAFTGIANAGGVGYIDYGKVIDNYDYAKQVTKEVDAKGLEMQQFLVDKEKEYKSLDTPLKKQTFEEKVAQEFKAKETAYVTLKNKREQEVFEGSFQNEEVLSLRSLRHYRWHCRRRGRHLGLLR